MERGVDIPKRSTAASIKRRKRIGKILQWVREDIAKIDRMTAAKRAGVSVYRWERWESGDAAIPAEWLPTISKGVGVDIMIHLSPELELKAA